MGIDLVNVNGTNGGVPMLRVTEKKGVFIEGVPLAGAVNYKVTGNKETVRIRLEVLISGSIDGGDELINT